MTVFPFSPDWTSPVVESFGYLTDIITAFRGTEQRIQLRAIPVGTISYSALCRNAREAQLASALLYGSRSEELGVARWQFQTPLVSEALEEGVELACDTTSLPFEVGGMVLVWVDPYSWEAATIDEVYTDHLVLTAGLESSWQPGVTRIVPMVLARFVSNPAVGWETLAHASQDLVFDVDGYRP